MGNIFNFITFNLLLNRENVILVQALYLKLMQLV